MMSDVGESTSQASAANGAQAPLSAKVCDACERVREADHRIANHLTLLAAYVHRTATDFAKRPSEASGIDVQLALQAISAQITSLAQIHRTLSTRGDEVRTLRDHLHSICRGIASLSEAIDIQEDLFPDCLVEADQTLPILQIVSEVVTNAVKYARSPDGRATLLVRCCYDVAGRIRIEITDHGPGLPKGFDAAIDGGLGFRLLRACAKQLQAGAEFRSTEAGLCFQLTLPPPGGEG